MINNFWNYIKKLLKEYNKSQAIFVHWSPAEKSAYEKLQTRHFGLPNKKLLDLYQVFLDCPIVVKGALSYTLKSVAKALYENKLINTIWDTRNQCSNGLNAMLLAYNLYKNNKNVTTNLPTMKEIESYNEIDCKCLYEIIMYLRKNH